MGSGRDKRKKAKGGHKPGVGADKTAKKTEKNAAKVLRRVDRLGDEDDIDALLEKFKLEDEANTSVAIEEDCSAPSPRVYTSFHPLNDKEILLFGGEWYDGDADKMYVYADVYILHTEKLTWRRVISPGGPLPRSSHQAVLTRAYMYVFGGEFTSLNQTKFRHYGDLWRLDLNNWRWEQLPTRGGPSPRSGHRMVLHKGRLILFGGFFDNGKETRYYNDLWSFNLEDLQWECLGPKPGQTGPSPRGGCQLALHSESATVYLIGGYSLKTSGTSHDSKAGENRKITKGEDEVDRPGIIHDDVWALNLTTTTWERVKRAGMAPTPRTSFGLVVHKGRAIFFGGVFDREGAGDRLYSELFNEAYQFNLVSRRWFPLTLRAPSGCTAAKSDATAPQDSKSTEIPPPPPGVDPQLHDALMRLKSAKDSPMARAATRIQAVFRGHMVRTAYRTYKLGGPVSELLYSPAAYGIDLSATNVIRPRARAAPAMAVLRNTLWLWGGQVEIGHTDVVLDDLWSLDLNKLDGWRCLRENTAGEDAFKDLSEEGEEEGWETE